MKLVHSMSSETFGCNFRKWNQYTREFYVLLVHDTPEIYINLWVFDNLKLEVEACTHEIRIDFQLSAILLYRIYTRRMRRGQ